MVLGLLELRDDEVCTVALRESLLGLEATEVAYVVRLLNCFYRCHATAGPLWAALCTRLWEGKVYVPVRYRAAILPILPTECSSSLSLTSAFATTLSCST